MIAHVVLRRTTLSSSESSSALDPADDFYSSMSLGLRVIGGQPNPLSRQPSAYVAYVRKDSVADTVGRLQAGDEIVKWNDTLLRGLSHEQVHAVLVRSKNETQIELVVERTLE